MGGFMTATCKSMMPCSQSCIQVIRLHAVTARWVHVAFVQGTVHVPPSCHAAIQLRRMQLTVAFTRCHA